MYNLLMHAVRPYTLFYTDFSFGSDKRSGAGGGRWVKFFSILSSSRKGLNMVYSILTKETKKSHSSLFLYYG
jgi:hypothetical protein